MLYKLSFDIHKTMCQILYVCIYYPGQSAQSSHQILKEPSKILGSQTVAEGGAGIRQTALAVRLLVLHPNKGEIG